MKIRIIISLLMLASIPAMGQRKIIQKLLSNEKDTTRKASFMPVPVLGYSQEAGFEFGLGALYSFYIDKRDTLNRSSNFSGTSSYSTKGTYHISLKGDAWTKGNKYHLIGETKFKKMFFNYFGIGNDTKQIDEDKLLQQQIKIQFDLEKTFIKNAYSGVSLAFENYNLTDRQPGGIYGNSNLAYPNGSSLLYLGVSQSFDTRNSNNYPTKGFFGRITYQYAPSVFGDANFSGSQLKINLRNFWTIAPKVVLGIQGIYHTVQSNRIPLYVLPQLGNDEMMRGYYTGRFRDENLLATQAEIRYRFMNRFGIVAFTGTGKVFKHNAFDLNDFKPNYGIGGRYFFDTAKGLSVRLDYGVGEQRPNEKRQAGFYIGLAEAF